MSLGEYRSKRDFSKTDEPEEGAPPPHDRPIFVVQEHHASHLHYDFRLEADGVLKSWAIPKGPSLDPSQKRLAVQVEDHPLSYATFEGTIPEGEYGAGTVSIWDQGTYELLPAEGATRRSVAEAIKAGRLEFVLSGRKLRGRFTLIRFRDRHQGRSPAKPQWLLIKSRDEFAHPEVSSHRVAGAKSSCPGEGLGRPGHEDFAPATPDSPSPILKKPPRARSSPRRKSRATAADGPPGEVQLTHPDKVLDPASGTTKADVFAYHERVADRLLPFLKDRPATLERLPEGLGGPEAPHFWQKHTPDYYPDWIARVELPSERGKPVRYALVNDRETLLYLVNQNTLTFHVWFSRLADLDRPDFVLFDLDPGRAAWEDAVAVASELHGLLDDEGVESFVKTSGKTGLHVLVPWASEGGYDAARDWAAGIARRVAGALPDRATVEIRKAKRGGRVYLDVLQNARGHHAVPPYVLRAVAGLPVSTPLRWSELAGVSSPAEFNIRTIFRRLASQKRDPFAGLMRRIAQPARAGRATVG